MSYVSSGPYALMGLLALLGGLRMGRVGSDRERIATFARAQRSDTIVKVAGPPRYSGKATLTLELTIGSRDGSPDYSFNALNEVAIGRDGSMYVRDFQTLPRTAPTVRQYDGDGRFVRRIGRSGQGPGEYNAPAGIALLPDGRIAILDASPRRINLYSSTGEFVAAWRLPLYTMTAGSGGKLGVDTAGTLYLHTSGSPRTVGEPRLGMIVRLSDRAVVLDTVLAPLSGTAAIGPYWPRAHFSESPFGYIVSAVATRYAFEILAPPATSASPRSVGSAPIPRWAPGDPVVSIRRDVPAVRLSSEEHADHVEHARGDQHSPETPRYEVPRQKAPFSELMVALDGRIWTRVAVPSERYDPPAEPNLVGRVVRPVSWREPVVYDVFEPSGVYLGQVGVPYGTTLLAMRGDTVWARITDADGVPLLRRFRIAWR